jgi:hypothetical protein
MSIAIYAKVQKGRRENRHSFADVVRRLDEIILLLAALAVEGDDRTEAKALAADVINRTKALRDAIPKQP